MEVLSIANPSVKKKRVEGEQLREALMLSMNLSLSLPEIPALLLIINHEGKITVREEEEGGSIQIENLIKKVAWSEYNGVKFKNILLEEIEDGLRPKGQGAWNVSGMRIFKESLT